MAALQRKLAVITRASLLALLLTGVQGCSLIGMRRPPAGPLEPDPPVACTASNVAPWIDAAFAAFSIAGGVAGLSYQCPPHQPGDWFDLCMKDSMQTLGVFSMLVGLTFVGSAAYGFHAASDCHGLLDAQQACRAGDGLACELLRLREAPRPAPVIDLSGSTIAP